MIDDTFQEWRNRHTLVLILFRAYSVTVVRDIYNNVQYIVYIFNSISTIYTHIHMHIHAYIHIQCEASKKKCISK